QLYNPHTQIFRDAEIGFPFFPFEISIIKYFSDGSTEERILESRQIEIELNEMITERGRTFPITNLSIRVKNIHPARKFYVAGVYLSMNFLADAGLFPEKGQFLEPQEKIDTPKLRLAHAPYLDANGWDESREIIKLVFCEEAFTSEMFELPPLPYPEIKGAKNIPQADQYRDIPGKKTPPKADWATLFFEIISRRPYT
ncbi:MAG: hypothetical protein KDD99_32760, partial [Bacteroidetes bacterium]|nr:hypothetical protein [Bacteroidota bacterium]